MKQAKEEMRAEYQRSDFTKLERGKFYKEVAKGTAVACLVCSHSLNKLLA